MASTVNKEGQAKKMTKLQEDIRDKDWKLSQLESYLIEASVEIEKLEYDLTKRRQEMAKQKQQLLDIVQMDSVDNVTGKTDTDSRRKKSPKERIIVESEKVTHSPRKTLDDLLRLASMKELTQLNVRPIKWDNMWRLEAREMFKLFAAF